MWVKQSNGSNLREQLCFTTGQACARPCPRCWDAAEGGVWSTREPGSSKCHVHTTCASGDHKSKVFPMLQETWFITITRDLREFTLLLFLSDKASFMSLLSGEPH